MEKQGLASGQPEPGSAEALAAVIDDIRETLPHNDLAESISRVQIALGILAPLADERSAEALGDAHFFLSVAEGHGRALQERMSIAELTLAAYIATLTADVNGATDPADIVRRATQRKQHSPRETFQSTRGFALYTDANDALMDHMRGQPVPRLPDVVDVSRYQSFWEHGEPVCEQNPAGLKLFLVTSEITRTLPDRSTLLAEGGVTDTDLTQSEELTFANGFGDIDFPWYFPAAVANEITDFFVDSGVMTQEQKDNLTMRDWADIVGAPWFSRVMHLFALTSNGFYQTFGKAVEDFQRHALGTYLTTRLERMTQEPIFQYRQQTDPDGTAYATANVHPGTIKELRKFMQAGDGVGCPVARYSVLLPEELVQNDPHTRRLIENGTLTILPEQSRKGFVRATQEVSAIDKTLQLFAGQLSRYHDTHGHPVFVPDTTGDVSPETPTPPPRIEHHTVEPVNALREPPANGENATP